MCNLSFSFSALAEDDTSGAPYHRERRNAISSQTATPGALDRSISEEPSTSTEERPPLLKKELHSSLPHLPDHALPYRGTLFAMDPRNSYLDSHYSKSRVSQKIKKTSLCRGCIGVWTAGEWHHRYRPDWF